MTDALEKLRGFVEAGRAPREVEDGIYSVLPGGTHAAHLYDRRAAVYDLLVGTRLYNRVLWGDTPRYYEGFAWRAFASGAGGAVLDAACGSMLFSAPAYPDGGRPVV